MECKNSPRSRPLANVLGRALSGEMASTMSSCARRRGGARPGAGRKKAASSKQLSMRVSEELFDRWKELKILRRAKSDAELLEYLLDLAAATDQESSFR